MKNFLIDIKWRINMFMKFIKIVYPKFKICSTNYFPLFQVPCGFCKKKCKNLVGLNRHLASCKVKLAISQEEGSSDSLNSSDRVSVQEAQTQPPQPDQHLQCQPVDDHPTGAEQPDVAVNLRLGGAGDIVNNKDFSQYLQSRLYE